MKLHGQIVTLSFLLICVLCISSCSYGKKPALPREQWLIISTKVYEGATVDQISKNVEKLFDLADKDSRISYTTTGMKVFRWANFPPFSTFYYHWDIHFTEVPEGVKVAVDISASVPPHAPSVWDFPEVYKLFFERLDYLMGTGKKWTTCKEYSEIVSKTPLAPLCRGVKDLRP